MSVRSMRSSFDCYGETMLLSMTSDYVKGMGDPAPYLARIASAGFTHVHWCHQWNTDFIYSAAEVEHIARALRDNGLRLLNLHASHGMEKGVASTHEHERLAGVELVRNRLHMTARLGGEAIILHAPDLDSVPFRRTLAELEREFIVCGVRLAIENTGGNFPALLGYLRDFPPEYLGICYDSGHANLPEFAAYARDWPEIAPRIYAFHLHDNDGLTDQHLLPFAGTIDWERVARLIAASPCRGNVNLESNMRCSPDMSEEEHLAHALAAARKLAEMVGAGLG